MASASEIAEALSSTLNPEPNARISAELKLAETLKNPGSALSLAHLILAQDVPMSTRQHSANVVLRKYVQEHWSPFFQQFRGDAPPNEIKAQIRQVVFQGLSDPDRKIRTLCAHTLSRIANCDWPDEYPDLLSGLIGLLSSGSTHAVHGAMQVFTEFIKQDLTEDQILPVLRDLLPVLLSILGDHEQHTPLTRSRTIAVFSQCVEALYMVKDQHPQAVKEASASVLPAWLDAFKVLLELDPAQDVATENWDALAIRVEVYRTLSMIHTSFLRPVTPYLPAYLSASLNHLQTLLPTFTANYLHSSGFRPQTLEDEPQELTRLMAALIDFVSSVARGGKAKSWFETDQNQAGGSNLAPLVTMLVRWAQMTRDNEEEWAEDANLFVAQEEDETQAYSVRVAVFDLFLSLLDRAPVPTVRALQSTIRDIVAESRQAREAGNSDWWRPLEAGLAVIGSQAEPVQDCIDDEEASERPKPLDLEYLLAEVIPSLLTLSECPFLQGRCLVFASRFAKLLPTHIAGQYLDAAVQVVESADTGIPFKISAIKAIHNFCQGIDDAAVLPVVPRIARDIGPFLLQATEDTLSLVLETLSVVVEVDQSKWVTPELANDLVLALLEVWMKNIKDPIFLSMLTDIFTTLASSPTSGVYSTVVSQSLPKLSSAIRSSTKEESWVASSAIELVGSLVEGAQEGLGDGFFGTVAEGLFNCLNTAEDRDVLQNGVSLLTLVVRKDVNQLVQWTDSRGQTGLANTLSVVAKLLQNDDESGGLVLGNLIIQLLRRAGEAVLPVLPELLQAMLARMRTAKTASFLQSLIIPFAFLIYNQRDVVLDLVESITLDSNQSGIAVLLNTWCENAETFQGFWPTRISNLGLCQLFTAALTEGDRRKNLLMNVKGDIIVKEETRNVIMTRSKTKIAPHEFTSIPFPVKALKLLLHDLQTNGEAASMAAPDGASVDSDDGDDDWEEDGSTKGGKIQGFTPEEFQYLSEVINTGAGGVSFDNDEAIGPDEDEDLRNDPIAQIDLKTHLVSFIRECATHNPGQFENFVSQLNKEEMIVVQRVIQEGRQQ